MSKIAQQSMIDKPKTYQTVYYLALFTIFYNVIEGIFATYFGYKDECLSLFGFGLDSFVEVISGLGIAMMIKRIQHNNNIHSTQFEQKALQITGIGFYLISIGLVVQSIYNIYVGNIQENAGWGIVISIISIVVMYILINWKIKLGNMLQSNAIIADAKCARVCMYMSFVLLISNLIFTITGFKYIDSIGALFIAYLSYIEGKECFDKIKNPDGHCHC